MALPREGPQPDVFARACRCCARPGGSTLCLTVLSLLFSLFLEHSEPILRRSLFEFDSFQHACVQLSTVVDVVAVIMASPWVDAGPDVIWSLRAAAFVIAAAGTAWNFVKRVFGSRALLQRVQTEISAMQHTNSIASAGSPAGDASRGASRSMATVNPLAAMYPPASMNPLAGMGFSEGDGVWKENADLSFSLLMADRARGMTLASESLYASGIDTVEEENTLLQGGSVVADDPALPSSASGAGPTEIQVDNPLFSGKAENIQADVDILLHDIVEMRDLWSSLSSMNEDDGELEDALADFAPRAISLRGRVKDLLADHSTLSLAMHVGLSTKELADYLDEASAWQDAIANARSRLAKGRGVNLETARDEALAEAHAQNMRERAELESALGRARSGLRRINRSSIGDSDQMLHLDEAAVDDLTSGLDDDQMPLGGGGVIFSPDHDNSTPYLPAHADFDDLSHGRTGDDRA